MFADEIGFIDPRKSRRLLRPALTFQAGERERPSDWRSHIEILGPMEVYDIQTESGEYLSGNLRVHNCFILAVDDSMDSILNWYEKRA